MCGQASPSFLAGPGPPETRRKGEKREKLKLILIKNTFFSQFLLHFCMPRPRNQVPILVFRAESEFEVKNAEFRAPEAKKRD